MDKPKCVVIKFPGRRKDGTSFEDKKSNKKLTFFKPVTKETEQVYTFHIVGEIV